MFLIAAIVVLVLGFGCAAEVDRTPLIVTGSGASAHQCRPPVQYRLYDSDMTSIDSIAVKAALKLWNDTVGFELFTPARYENAIELHIGMVAADALGDPNNLAVTNMLFDEAGCVSIAAVAIPQGKLAEYDEAKRIWIIAHELGHVLGLDHMILDDGNLMAPVVPKGTPLSRPRLECDQRRALAASIPIDLSMCK